MKQGMMGITVAAAVMAAVATPSMAETLRFGHAYEVSEAFHQRALAAAEQIKEETDGRYEIEIFPASVLGSQPEMHESINLGTLDMGFVSPGLLAEIYPPIQIHLAAFLWRDLDHFFAYPGSDIYKDIVSGYEEESGNKIFGLTYYGQRHVTSNTEINAPEDMQGMKIRIPEVPVIKMFTDAVGANATPIAFAEVYLALQQGTVDAQENPLPTIAAKRFHEVQSHITLTGHTTDGFFTVMNGDVWDGLSDEDKDIFARVWAEAAAKAGQDIVEQEKGLVEQFRSEGVTVTEVDRGPFIEAVKPEWQNSSYGWTAEQIEAILVLGEPDSGE